MAATPCANMYSSSIVRKNRSISVVGLLAFPLGTRPARGFSKEIKYFKRCSDGVSPFQKRTFSSISKRLLFTIPRCSGSSDLSGDKDKTSNPEKTPFGYTRKDVLLIGFGLTAAGIGLKIGLEYLGVDPLQAGNAVQLVLVLGLTVGWISTYIFRVSNKEMTYAQQLRDYEDKVMQKRLESLTEAEIEALLQQVEEEKQQSAGGEQVK